MTETDEPGGTRWPAPGLGGGGPRCYGASERSSRDRTVGSASATTTVEGSAELCSNTDRSAANTRAFTGEDGAWGVAVRDGRSA